MNDWEILDENQDVEVVTEPVMDDVSNDVSEGFQGFSDVQTDDILGNDVGDSFTLQSSDSAFLPMASNFPSASFDPNTFVLVACFCVLCLILFGKKRS